MIKMREFFAVKGKGINWSSLLLALALALSLWVYVTVQDNPVIEGRFEVPIDYMNLPDDLALSDKADTVRVRVAAPTNVMNTLASSDINAYADLSAAGEGQYTALLRFQLPDNVELVSADSTEVVLVIKKLETRQKPVTVRYVSGEPAEGYLALDASLAPDHVVLSGSEDRLNQVAEVFVTVDITDTSANFRANLPVSVVDANGNSLLGFVTPQPALVDVLVPVVTAQPSKVVPVNVTLSGAPAEGYVISRIVVDAPVATIFGAQSALDNVDYIYTSAVNIADAKGNVTQEVTLLNADGLSFDREQVYRVVVTIEPEAVRTIDDVAITLVNQQPTLNYQLAELTCSVTVRGPASVVGALDAADIEARVDVDGLAAGEHRTAIRAVTSANATVEAVEPFSTITYITDK